MGDCCAGGLSVEHAAQESRRGDGRGQSYRPHYPTNLESRCRKVRHQPAVGVDALLDVGQVAALDDAVEPLGSTDQHAGLAARQRVGDQLPRRLIERTAVEQLDKAIGMREQQLDGLRLRRVRGIVDESPETGLPQARLVVVAGFGQSP